MTDQTIPADQARRARQWARDTLDDVENGANVSAYARDAARTLIAMMPRPTLADMTDEERAACLRMQCDTAELTYIDQGADTSDAVPEGTLAVGSVWADADALARACRESGRDHIVVADKRGGAGVWDTGMQCWRVTAPYVDFAPYTVIHAGRGVDQ